jgi:integrase
MPFRHYVASYLDTLSHLKPSTRLKVEGHLRNYVLPTFQDLPVAEVRPADVRAWISALLKHGLSPATVKAVHATFSRIMNQAVIDGVIARSPSFGLSLPKEGPGEEMKVMEPGQIAAVADAIDPRYRALIFTAAYTGMRWSELVALQTTNLDLTKASVRIRESLVEVNGTLHHHLCRVRVTASLLLAGQLASTKTVTGLT